MQFFTGIDGCRGGWFAVSIREDGSWVTFLSSSIKEIWKRNRESYCMLIDIPIGLTEERRPRECDMLARKFLGRGRSSSVFTPPCRQALAAADYREACSINERITGAKLSRQSWNIAPKIKEVDEFVTGTKNAGTRLLESHPEIGYLSIAGHAMKYRKGTPGGFEERRSLLQNVFPETYAVLSFALAEYRRSGVKKDDILDALMNAVTAKTGYRNLYSLPANPPVDGRGLPMAIWYYPVTDGLSIYTAEM